ncbi:hypothetical protein [Sphingomonas sp. MA1305]
MAFWPTACVDYRHWQNIAAERNDKINTLLEERFHDPLEGTGKA